MMLETAGDAPESDGVGIRHGETNCPREQDVPSMAQDAPERTPAAPGRAFSLWNVLAGALQGAVPFLILLDYTSRLRDGIGVAVVAQLAALTFFFLGSRQS